MNVMIATAAFRLNGALVRTAEDVAADLLIAKAAEAKAKDARVKLEEELVGFLGLKDEGSKTHTIDGFKVTIKSVLSRKVDWDVFDAVIGKIPEALQPVKVKRELDETGVKYLKNNEPKMYAIIAPAITVTPAKPQVVVARIE